MRGNQAVEDHMELPLGNQYISKTSPITWAHLRKGIPLEMGLVGSLASPKYGIHYPAGHCLFGDSFSLLLSFKADKELIRSSEALRANQVYAQSMY